MSGGRFSSVPEPKRTRKVRGSCEAKTHLIDPSENFHFYVIIELVWDKQIDADTYKEMQDTIANSINPIHTDEPLPVLARHPLKVGTCSWMSTTKRWYINIEDETKNLRTYK